MGRVRILKNKMHTAYHYTVKRNLDDIKGKTGLIPQRFPVPQYDSENLPKIAREQFIFAFLDEPYPTPWRKNEKYCYLWEKLIDHIRKKEKSEEVVRIKFSLNETDSVFVADWAHEEKLWYDLVFKGCRNYGERDAKLSEEAHKKYIASITPLKEYKGQHELPELLISNPISSERLTVDPYLKSFITPDYNLDHNNKYRALKTRKNKLSKF